MSKSWNTNMLFSSFSSCFYWPTLANRCHCHRWLCKIGAKFERTTMFGVSAALTTVALQSGRARPQIAESRTPCNSAIAIANAVSRGARPTNQPEATLTLTLTLTMTMTATSSTTTATTDDELDLSCQAYKLCPADLAAGATVAVAGCQAGLMVASVDT